MKALHPISTSPPAYTFTIGHRVVPVIPADLKSYELAGLCTGPPWEIFVDETLEKTDRASTILHELIHVLSDTYGLGLKERQVLGLEAGLVDLLHSNSAQTMELLVDFLSGGPVEPTDAKPNLEEPLCPDPVTTPPVS